MFVSHKEPARMVRPRPRSMGEKNVRERKPGPELWCGVFKQSGKIIYECESAKMCFIAFWLKIAQSEHVNKLLPKRTASILHRWADYYIRSPTLH